MGVDYFVGLAKILEITRGFHKCGGGHLPGDGCDCLCGRHYNAAGQVIINERPRSGIICKCKPAEQAEANHG